MSGLKMGMLNQSLEVCAQCAQERKRKHEHKEREWTVKHPR